MVYYEGMRVRVYYNLNKSVWSVQHYLPGKGWRVREHLTSLILEDVEFKVYEVGRQRVLANKRKNVHAFAIGELVSRYSNGYTGHFDRASYNPYKAAHFVNSVTGKRVDRNPQAIFSADRKVFIPRPA